MTTRAFRTLDCARKVRLRYYLPRAVDLELVEALPGALDELQRFSRFVDGARDHVRFSDGQRWRASAVLGENLLVVTFDKFGDGHDEHGPREFALALERVGCGPVLERAGSGEEARLA